MTIRWHNVAFMHSCGRQGTILEVCVSQDGGISLEGICAVCGENFTLEDTMANLIARSAIRDYLTYKAENPEDILADFVPKGKPN